MCIGLCVCVCPVCFCFVTLLLSSPFGLFLDFVRACACAVIKPELSPSHPTTEGHEVEKYKEEEQIQLLLEADGRSAP